MVFPLWTLPNSVPQIVGRRQLLAWCRRTDPIGNAKRYLVALTASNGMASFKTGFLHKQAGSDRGSIEVRSRSKRTSHPFSQRETSSKQNPTAAGRTQQQEEASSSMQNPAAGRKQQAEDAKTATAAAAAAAAAAGRMQQEEERYCRSTSSQPERSARVWHLQVWS